MNTEFEKLRLFNARRDWLVLSFEAPFAYLDEFDLLWQLSYERVLDGGLDRLSEQRHRADVDEAYLQFINTWRERLAQDIVANRGANPWAFHADGAIDVQTLRSVVQRILDRLVVVRFAEDHLIAPPGTLQSIYDLRQRNPYTFPLNQSYAQMFRVFDDLHNSGLFAYGLADQAVVSDDVLGAGRHHLPGHGLCRPAAPGCASHDIAGAGLQPASLQHDRGQSGLRTDPHAQVA